MGRRKIHTGQRTAPTPAARFLESARLCRTRDLAQMMILCELVKRISELVHALQKERGASSVYLGSGGAQFAEPLAARREESRALETLVRSQMERLDDELYRLGSGARFYTRIARAFLALELLPAARAQIRALSVAPQDAFKAFTDIIGSLLAVVFEVGDIAADPAISRALMALVNFSQAKEYAGQERATAGAGFSRGRLHADEHQRLQHLAAAQQHAFEIFRELAAPAHAAAFEQFAAGPDAQEVARMRAIALRGGRAGELAGISGQAWYEQSTRRIDAMKGIEERLADDLNRLCAEGLAATAQPAEAEAAEPLSAQGPLALLVSDVDPAASGPGLDAGVGLYSLDGAAAPPMRPILAVLQAQSRRIQEVSSELESARNALTERKIIERAKGLLMKTRGLSEERAYAQIREAAMNQNKRIIEIAESILSMADILLA